MDVSVFCYVCGGDCAWGGAQFEVDDAIGLEVFEDCVCGVDEGWEVIAEGVDVLGEEGEEAVVGENYERGV